MRRLVLIITVAKIRDSITQSCGYHISYTHPIDPVQEPLGNTNFLITDTFENFES